MFVSSIAKAVVAELKPLLEDLVKTAVTSGVDEANVNIKADIAEVRTALSGEVNGIPAAFLALLKELPIIGPMLSGVQWPSI